MPQEHTLRGEPGLEGKKNQFFESHLIRLEIYSEICLQNFRVKFQIVSKIWPLRDRALRRQLTFGKNFKRDFLETAFSCTAYTIKNVVIAPFL